MLQSLVLALLAIASPGDVKQEFIGEKITAKVGGYRPVKSEMTEESDTVKKLPENLTAPMFGELEFGDKKFLFILDEPGEDSEAEAALYVDTNGDGDLTNDPKAEWTPSDRVARGSARIDLGEGRLGKIELYRFNPASPGRESYKLTMLYYPDFGTKYTVSLDGEDFETYVSGKASEGDRLWLDRDKNGQRSSNYESVTIGEGPFNFTGTTYEMVIENGDLALIESEQELPQLPLPPDLSLGAQCLEFTAKTMDGSEIQFPTSYAGKLVMLDFWATWCGPCIGEIPHMKEAYSEYQDDGFEILGVSFDSADMEEKVTKFTEDRELPWAQIYEGKGWDTTLGKMHDVSGIPFVLLVDGDTGEIIGTRSQLRGPGLAKFVGEAIAKKNGTTGEAESDESEEKDGES